jgi:protein-tyrosine phosphatase
MPQRIFWIECGGTGRLAILSRPAPESLPAEVAAWRDVGVTMVASLLEPEEQRQLGLCDEAALCRAQGIAFASYPIPDGGVPASLKHALALVRRLARAIEAGGTVGVHCRASIGRSGMIAASVLIALGHTEDQALEAVAAGRGLRVPETPEQRAFLSLVAREADPRR